jgi:hypothetical protein
VIMQVKYKHKWTSGLDDDEIHSGTVLDWQHGLAGLTDAQIITGIESLPTGANDWPPLVGEFRTLCTGDDGLHRTGAYKPFERDASLTRIQHKKNNAAGKAHIAEIRKKLMR